MPTLLQYIQTFILAGSTVTGISYLGNTVNPLLGGILSGIPISIPSMLLINEASKKQEFIYSATLMVALLSVVTFICWYLYAKAKFTAKNSVIISFLIWSVGSALYYFLIVKK